MHSGSIRRWLVGVSVLVLAGGAWGWTSGREQEQRDPPEGSAPPATATIVDPDRSSPRASVAGYLEAARDEAWAEAARYLDLARVPERERERAGPELARQLKAVLDQDLWIDLGRLSEHPEGDTTDGHAQRDVVGALPHARGTFEVFVERTDAGDPPVPVWRFSASVVARIPELYGSIDMGPILERLPRVLTTTRFLEMALWQWIGLILLVVVGWVAAWLLAMIVVRIFKPLTLRSGTDLDDQLLALVVGPLRLLATVAFFFLGSNLFLLPPAAQAMVREVTKFLVIAGMAWLVFRLIELVAGLVRRRMAKQGQQGAVHLIPLGARAIKVAVGVMAVLAALDTFGFDITAIIAGLGIGGLAVALAAQKTFENVFGGVSVLVDQPVRPGDFCKFGDSMGTVEDVGLRSTRIRTLDRTMLTIPNADFSNLHLENLEKRDRFLIKTVLGLRYETSSDQLRQVIEALRRMLAEHPQMLPNPRVRLVNLGTYSLDLEVFAYVSSRDNDEFLAVREELYLRMLDTVAQSGTGFAFPSSTTYLARDGGVEGERRKAAEAASARRREAGRTGVSGPGREFGEGAAAAGSP